MNNVSSAWNRALLNDNRDYIEEVTILLADNSTVLQISNANIWGGGFTIEDAVSEESNFQIGAAIINKFTLVLNNLYDEYNDYVFEDAVLTVRVGLVTEESTEMIQKGRYIVNSAKYNGSLITLECYDFMSKFDKPYDDSFAVTYPATLDTIVRRACSLCGVTLATTDFPHKSYTVTERPESETTTCREVISWVAQIAGCFARMNSLGYLELKWYNQSDLESVMDGLDGGEFDSSTPYSTGDAADGGTFNPWNTGYVYDGGAFTWTNKTHLISSIYSEDISVDDVVITGVRILVKTKDDSGASSETIRAFMSGTEGYVIEISENPFITVDNAQEIVNWLGTQLNGFTFRKANVSHGSNPAIEAGDVAVVFDRKGGTFPIVVSKTTFSVGSSQTTISAAQTPTRNSAARYSVETKNYVEMRKRLKTEMTARQQAQADLAQRIASANGLYQTDVTTQGGGTKHYLHNKTNLNESDIQILVSDVGVTMTANGTDAQPTWYGLTVDGTLIANILSVSGINADWINAGQLVVEDQNGNETLFVDTQTGVVRINASSFSLTGNTIDSIAQSRANAALTSANNYTDSATASAKNYSDSQLADYKDVVDAAIEDLQDQIDGQFETYYYDYEPTLNNYPANEWTTTALKKEHEGDMFLWKSTGYAYRFFNMGTDQNPDWKWQAVSDSVASQAMAKAEDALALAGVKRRVFTSQPTPPYDQKDLWVEGANGDIKICAVSRASGTYVASDWELASKYTDDSALTTFLNGTYAVNLQSVQTQIDQKAETYYQSTDPSVNWTASQKPSHTGDLWYKTTDNSTWRYDGSQWVEQLVPTAVFDEIDEKKRIFVTQPVPPYDVRDLWVQGASGDIKVCQTARASGSYNASDWVMASKYTDDTVVKSQYGTCTTAASTAAKVVTLANFALYNGARISVKFSNPNTAATPTLNVNGTGAKQIRAYGSTLSATSSYNWSAGAVVDFVYDESVNYWYISDSSSLSKAKEFVNTLDNSLNQTEVYNRLTNNSQNEGVYLSNGHLYINASMINSGTINADRIAAGSLNANKIKGGTLTLGGSNNENGSLVVKNASGQNVVTANNSGLTATGTLTGSALTTAEADYPTLLSGDCYVEDSYKGEQYEAFWDYGEPLKVKYVLNNSGLTGQITYPEAFTFKLDIWGWGWRIRDALMVNGAIYTNRLYMGNGVGKYIYLTDSARNQYVGLGNNGSNLWIGASQTAAYHHRGGTYISAGHDGTSGNETIFVSVPNAANNGGTNYGVWHKGNLKNATTSAAGLMSADDKELVNELTHASTTVTIEMGATQTSSTASKRHGVVRMVISAYNSSISAPFENISSGVQIGTMPTGYRPAANIFIPGVLKTSTTWESATWYQCMVSVESSGAIKVLAKNTELHASKVLTCTLVYTV